MSEDKNKAVPLDLVKKYDRPGPRYTSYPTVPEWSDRYGHDDYQAAIRDASRDVNEPLSFYLHIPYCRKRCWFCGCNTAVAAGPEAADEYIRRIDKEVSMVKSLLDERKRISQFHWGGGTPSFLADTQTINAFGIFSKRFEILEDAEISIELDPRVTTKERIRLLKSLGFNRLSFGIQDFDKRVQEAIGRNQDEKMAIELYQYCRQERFIGINFDLIYGLPAQTIDSFNKTVEKTVDLRPDRIALYSFAYLPEGKSHQKKINTGIMPSAETKFALFNLARKMFSESGYSQIGMDHFVLPADELALAAANGKLRRNFMGYTVNAAKDWIGIGASSISFISNNFAQNVNGIDSYKTAIDSGIFATYRGMKLSHDDLIRQHIISELMCNFRLDLKELEDKFDINPNQYFSEELKLLEPYIEDGLLSVENEVYMVAQSGKTFVRNIAMTFDAYLKKTIEGKSKVQFSRTI